MNGRILESEKTLILAYACGVFAEYFQAQSK